MPISPSKTSDELTATNLKNRNAEYFDSEVKLNDEQGRLHNLLLLRLSFIKSCKKNKNEKQNKVVLVIRANTA